MQISIKQVDNYAEPVSITINDYCNHAGAEERELEFTRDSWNDDVHMYVPDDSYFENVLYCDNCHSYQGFDGFWEEDK